MKYFNKLAEIKYLLLKCEKKKRVIVSFRGTVNYADVIDDKRIQSKLNDYVGRCHSGYDSRTQNVPLGYIEELLAQCFELIFTGHSLGAAVSVLVAVKLLLLPYVTEKIAEKILFIGFGCQSIADIYFKNEIEK